MRMTLLTLQYSSGPIPFIPRSVLSRLLSPCKVTWNQMSFERIGRTFVKVAELIGTLAVLTTDKTGSTSDWQSAFSGFEKKNREKARLRLLGNESL